MNYVFNQRLNKEYWLVISLKKAVEQLVEVEFGVYASSSSRMAIGLILVLSSARLSCIALRCVGTWTPLISETLCRSALRDGVRRWDF